MEEKQIKHYGLLFDGAATRKFLLYPQRDYSSIPMSCVCSSFSNIYKAFS